MVAHPAVEADELRRRLCIEGPADELDALLAADLSYVHTSGLVDTKESFLERIRSGDLVYSRIESESSSVHDYGQVACIAGVMLIDVVSSGTARSFRCRYVEEWQSTDGGWNLRYWQSTLVPGS